MGPLMLDGLARVGFSIALAFGGDGSGGDGSRGVCAMEFCTSLDPLHSSGCKRFQIRSKNVFCDPNGVTSCVVESK